MVAKHLSENRLLDIHNINIDVKNREIYLQSPIEFEEEGGVDFRSSINFTKNMNYLTSLSYDPILIHMYLPGGIWEDGLGIYDVIKECPCKTIIVAYAKVQSASSIIFQAADVRVLMPNTHILIHYGSLSIDDEHKAVMSNLEWSEKESQKMIDIFTERCLNSPMAKEKKWKKMIIRKHIMTKLDTKSDWILDAQESLYYGFADGVLGDSNFNDIHTIKYNNS